MLATRGKMAWVGLALSVLLSLLFAMSAIMKLTGGGGVMEGMAHLGLPESLIVPLGLLEISCVAIYLISATSIVGAILLTGYLGGAILAHVRVGDPFFFQIVLGVCVWLGLYLRDSRLRELLPVRTSRAVDFGGARSTSS